MIIVAFVLYAVSVGLFMFAFSGGDDAKMRHILSGVGGFLCVMFAFALMHFDGRYDLANDLCKQRGYASGSSIGGGPHARIVCMPRTPDGVELTFPEKSQ